MKVSVNTKIDKRVLDSLIQRLATLDGWEGQAGFDDSQHPHHGETLAQIMLINEYGGYNEEINARIPSRPAMRTAAPLSATEIARKCQTLWNQFLNSQIKAPTFYKKLAEEEATWIADIIRTNSFTPNTRLTLKHKQGTQPLVDTGYLADNVKATAVKKDVV